jgi:hypothetical protein
MIRRVVLLMLASVGATAIILAQPERLAVATPIEKVALVVVPGQRPTMVIRPAVPDGDPLCAERRDGFVACRTVGEFRQWVQQVEKK